MMNKQLRKWILRLTATGVLIAGLLIVIILNPVLSYGGRTHYTGCTVYHNKPLDPALPERICNAIALVRKSEYYNPAFRLQLCINDGSKYPLLMRALRGDAFGWGFYNKVVLMGEANYKADYVQLNGYRWNLTQLLAHEMIHCYQLDARGFWHSNPAAGIDEWKWEGYPEYIARQGADQKDLAKNIDRLNAAEQTENNGWIQFSDSTGTVLSYYRSWLLVQYCMDIRQQHYAQLLDDTATEETLRRQMMHWYQQQQ